MQPTTSVTAALPDHSAPGHRCTECHLRDVIARLTGDLNLVSRERTRLADELRATSARAVRAEEERDIARGQAKRAIEQKEAMFEQLFELEQRGEAA